MARVILEKVDKSFGAVKAADRVSFEIADGEFFTLLGPSGCGKTTTLRLVAGLEFADRGRIVIGERDVTNVPPAERRLAMVFQNYALYPHMSVRENIGYPLKIRKLAPAEIASRVGAVAERLGIAGVLDRAPAEISGGQQQRTAVARAMVGDPRVYLFDEPLSNLDARLRLESRRFLKRALADAGGTAIYVTHDQTEAMALSDRVGVMKDGRLVQVAPPDELYSRPDSTFVAGFVGNPPMNLVEGVAEVDNGLWFCSGGFRARLPDGVEVASGARITLGARPEDVSLLVEGGMIGEIDDVESLGSEQIVTINADGVTLYARVVGGRPPKRGERVGLSFEKLHVFDQDGGRLKP